MLIRFDRDPIPDLYARCKHTECEVRKMPIQGGDFQLKRQCLVCGESVGNAQKKTHLRAEETAKIPQWDQNLSPRYIEAREKRHDALVCEADERAYNKWKTQYETYRATPEWAQRRQLILSRAQGICEGCRSAPAAEVHHTTYIHAGEEFLFELVAVCAECHRRYHATSRSRRAQLILETPKT